METEVFGRASAAAIAIAGGNLPITTQFNLQETMLKVSNLTKVKTANGIIDLRYPNTDATMTSTHRVHNNHLTAMTGNAATMHSNLPVRSNNVGSEMTLHPHIVSIPGGGSDPTEIIELSSSSSSLEEYDARKTRALSSSSSSMEEYDARKPRALNDTHFAASNMHARIISRVRKDLTSLVRNKDRTEEEEIAKKKLKITVKTLQKEKESGDHIATILDVTSDGHDLITSPMIDSQDCLELVMDLHAD